MTKCPDCGRLFDPETTPGVRVGRKREWVTGGGFGAGQGEWIIQEETASFHPECDPARAGYIEDEAPPQP